jgi:membrane protein YdbS with pleckstrin-like domain
MPYARTMSDGDEPPAGDTAGGDDPAVADASGDTTDDRSDTADDGSAPSADTGGDVAADGSTPAASADATEPPGDGAGDTGSVADASTEREPLDPSEIDVSALVGPERTLEPRVRLAWMLRSAVVAFVLGTVAGAVAVFLDLPVWVGPGLFTLLFVLGTVRAHLRYESWSYHVRTDSLFLDRGVLTRVRTVVPYVRIQHVDASRGPVERLFGLATVVVYTAGSRGADVSIPGLTPDRADDLQERLKRLAIAAEGEDAV